MLTVLYEDKDILAVRKPAGLESQSGRSFEPDMVSEIRRHLQADRNIHRDIHKLATGKSTSDPPYVGVIHRLDKPVEGVMVYAKNQKAAAALTVQLQQGKMEKYYRAVVCGQPVDNHGGYVDYLRKMGKNGGSEIVDKSDREGKRAELTYEVLSVVRRQEKEEEKTYALLEIHLLTGRHHQIRCQLAGHGTPILGDERYAAPQGMPPQPGRTRRPSLALCACRLAFFHPVTGKRMEFSIEPSGEAYGWFGKTAGGFLGTAAADRYEDALKAF